MEKEQAEKLIRAELEKSPVFQALFGGGRCDAAEADPTTMTKHVGQFNLKDLASKWSHQGFNDVNWAELYKHQVFGDTHVHIQNLRSRELNMLDNLTKFDKSVDSRNLPHVPVHDRSFINLMTVYDELMASLTAKTGVQQDVAINALLGYLVDRLVPIVQEQMKKAEAEKKA